MLPELMAAFAPTVAYRKSVYAKNVRIPEDAIELQLQMQLVKALRTYDPTKGASVNTHVVNYLHGVQRWIGENQNIGRIPENRIYKIRPYKNALVELTEELVRQPTDTEVAERLGWDVKEVERMRKELRSDLYTQGFDNDPASYTPSKRLELLHMFVSELEGEERVLYEYLTGINRERVESTNELARLLGKEPYKISRMKERIAKRLEVHLADLDTEDISAEDDDDDE
jgi:DNA-directed RNA polymerase specialized sigma subunit